MKGKNSLPFSRVGDKELRRSQVVAKFVTETFPDASTLIIPELIMNNSGALIASDGEIKKKCNKIGGWIFKEVGRGEGRYFKMFRGDWRDEREIKEG